MPGKRRLVVGMEFCNELIIPFLLLFFPMFSRMAKKHFARQDQRKKEKGKEEKSREREAKRSSLL